MSVKIYRGRIASVCVGDSNEASRICYGIATYGENIDQPASEVALFHTKPLPPRPVTPP
jgi:hypothetical protein